MKYDIITWDTYIDQRLDHISQSTTLNLEPDEVSNFVKSIERKFQDSSGTMPKNVIVITMDDTFNKQKAPEIMEKITMLGLDVRYIHSEQILDHDTLQIAYNYILASNDDTPESKIVLLKMFR